MTELRAFIPHRRTQLEEELNPLLKRRTELRSELEQVIARITRLNSELDEIRRVEQAIGGNDEGERSEPRRLTIKKAVLKVLADAKDGMTAQQILAAINERFFGGEVVRSSLSPQLSRLHHIDHKITFDGTLYSLDRKNDEGPAKAEPSFLD